MIAARKGQEAALAASAPPSRTPERQALADAIAARDHVAILIEERRAVAREIEESRLPLYERERELERQLLSLPADEGDRLHALLNRQDPDRLAERAACKREIAEVKEQEKASWDRQRRAEADIRLLEEDHASRVRDIERAAGAVIRSDPAVPAVMAEYESVAKRAAILRRACGSALNRSPPNGGYLPQSLLAGKTFVPEAPCPWEQATAHLLNDPDAVLPMPEDV